MRSTGSYVTDPKYILNQTIDLLAGVHMGEDSEMEERPIEVRGRSRVLKSGEGGGVARGRNSGP